MPLAEKADYVSGVLSRLEKYLETSFATATATTLWRERIGFYLNFYRRLRDQLAVSTLDGEMPHAHAGEPNWEADGRLGLAGRM